MTSENATTIRNPLQNLLSHELRRASVGVMGAFANALQPLGLRPSEASMLMIIGANPGCNQSDISRALRMQPANMVPIINHLVLTGSLEKVPAEGRAIPLFLTQGGVALLEQVEQTVARHERRISRHLPTDVREKVVEALRMICKDACCTDT
jgi:DNA-binding MarR family transcriptional regulator